MSIPNPHNKIRNVLLLTLPILFIAGFALSTNLYFDLDMGLGRIMTWDDQMFKGTVYLGAMEFAADSGEIVWVNMPVSTTTASLPMSYTAKIDGQDILTVYSETDGAGSIENKRVGIATTTPEYALDVNGDFRVTSTSFLAAIDSGIWQATEISPSFGGTGLTSFSSGDILIATTSAEFSRLAIGTESQVLTVSSGNLPEWAAVEDGAEWTLSDNYLYPDNLAWQVGIGTSTPQYALDVDGDFRVTATSTFSGNVGIGTALPGYRLDISGVFSITGFIMPTGASSSYVLTSDASGTGIWQEPDEVVGTGDVSGSGDIGYLARFFDPTTLEDSIIYESDGKIGIGTTTLTAKLNVYDTGDQLRLAYSGSNYADFSVNATGDLTINPSSGNFLVRTTGEQNYLRVYSTSTEYIQLTHSGSAGILTSSSGELEIGQTGLPVYIEQVTNLTASSSLTALTVRQNGTGNIAEFRSLFGDTGVTDNFYDETKISTTTALAVDTTEGEVRFEWQCGADITFTYRGEQVTYGTVYNPTTTECWMDRNLGATRVAETYDDGESDTDSSAYGDLFQWGRLDDNHQDRESGTTALEATSDSDDPGHSDFILTNEDPWDWRIPQNHDLWQGDGSINDPCPPGWRVPTEAEWDAERQSWSSHDYHGAIESPLKLPAAGYRSRSTGSLNVVGAYGYYWSSTVSDTFARFLFFSSTNAGMTSSSRAGGRSVRCLQD